MRAAAAAGSAAGPGGVFTCTANQSGSCFPESKRQLGEVLRHRPRALPGSGEAWLIRFLPGS